MFSSFLYFIFEGWKLTTFKNGSPDCNFRRRNGHLPRYIPYLVWYKQGALIAAGWEKIKLLIEGGGMIRIGIELHGRKLLIHDLTLPFLSHFVIHATLNLIISFLNGPSIIISPKQIDPCTGYNIRYNSNWDINNSYYIAEIYFTFQCFYHFPRFLFVFRLPCCPYRAMIIIIACMETTKAHNQIIKFTLLNV